MKNTRKALEANPTAFAAVDQPLVEALTAANELAAEQIDRLVAQKLELAQHLQGTREELASAQRIHADQSARHRDQLAAATRRRYALEQELAAAKEANQKDRTEYLQRTEYLATKIKHIESHRDIATDKHRAALAKITQRYHTALDDIARIESQRITETRGLDERIDELEAHLLQAQEDLLQNKIV